MTKMFLLTPLALFAGAVGAAPLPAWQALDAPALFALRNPAATAAQRIRVDGQALRTADRLTLALPGGHRHAIDVVARELRADGDLWLLGRLDGEATAQVSLSLSGGHLGGLVSAPEGNYEITSAPDGSQVVVALDQDAFPECATNEFDRVGNAPADVPRQPFADPPSRTDVLIVFSPQAHAALGSTMAQTKAFAQSMVDSSNTAFRNSDMTTRFRLAGVRVTARNEAGNSGDDLTWVGNDAEVAGWRNDVAADLVSMVTETMSDACGRGYLQGSPGPGFAASAYQVTARGCAVGNLSYVHEHGHNMGMGHDPGNGNGAYAYSFGHFVSGSFRTVMAYSTNCTGGCTRRPYFSNPAVNYGGAPTGVANERDNHRTGNETANFTANFRASEIIFLDGFQPAI
ncbi:MAG TPA: M12 family metallo-peptidase [Tahibacter sp.]|uniref:M12 family metallo-peptidase n=1 Tax=Tahibacter sp. TaxID=2056211 RepID=UPI002C412B98|nr:M12 family metallo-peptidase [Tahibacter sp.]HSX60600.1 M12 family metallo-peptidase [Tahibacter sp.]